MPVVVGYLITALILSLCIPVFGFIMSGIIKILYGIVASVLGNKIAYFIFNRLTFVGVFHHEISHALLATLTGAKVTKIVFFKPEGDRLGYVQYNARGNIFMRSIQQTFASIVPVACGAISSLALGHFIKTTSLSWWLVVLLSYVLVSIIIHMTMSSQDFKVMWKGYPIVYLILFIVVLIFKYSFW